MARENYFQLNRSVQNHWVWRDKPFAKGQAWVDLLLLANYKNVKIPYKGKVITCKRGVVNLSITELADRWGWSRHKTSDFLKLLESDEMVTVERTPHRTTITIENYRKFQDEGTTKGQQGDIKGTSKEKDALTIGIYTQNENNTQNLRENEQKKWDEKGTSKGATESIEKYTNSQDCLTTKGQQKDSKRTASGQQADTTKKVKKDKKDKKYKKEIYKEKFGEFQNVLLTDAELVKLKNRLPNYEDFIERLSAYKESTGKNYKSDYATILNWSRKEKKESVDFLDL